MSSTQCSFATPDELVLRAQSGDAQALEEVLERFRPLLRSRMHRLWTAIREELTGLEWADVESQVHCLFITRLRRFQPEQGVFFAHYIEQMLSFDCTAWLREQRRSSAVPFSQLGTEAGDPETWMEGEVSLADSVERVLSLRTALDELSLPQREAVWQVCVLGRTEDEVAQNLQISRSAVRNRLTSGLSRLREFFQQNQSLPEEATRTGRRSARLATLDYWTERINMAKDEKRPDLIGIGAGRPILLQGIFTFEATGINNSQLLSTKLRYVVPPGHVAGIRFFRAGVMCEKMVCLSTVVNGMTHRLVPIAANASVHVPFAIVEPIVAGSEIEIHIASEAGGTAIIDVGCLQMPA